MALPECFRTLYATPILPVLALAASNPIFAQRPENVLVVVNDKSAVSRSIGDYYTRKRAIPRANICRIEASPEELISRPDYERTVALPIRTCLEKNGLVESVLYIVTTLEVPLKIEGTTNSLAASESSVDSELTLLYSDIKQNKPHRLEGSIPNPFYRKMNVPFTHPEFPIYLVTRLAAYDFPGVRDMIDRSLRATNKGKFVIDMKTPLEVEGDDWLRTAAIRLPADRVVADQTFGVLYEQTDVIGYAGWGSNDKNRHRRFLGFHWLPGAIVTEYVSSNGRTFKKPPDDWNISDWTTPKLWWAGAPQTLTADYILEGATGASGHVFEPFLTLTPHPEFLLPAYLSGRTLAESYYLAIPALSWQNIVVGDPLCSLGKP
jgi:uncharacterized protein (TIGR03790 family)